MHVARVESERDASPGLLQHQLFATDPPLTTQGPTVECQPVGDVIEHVSRDSQCSTASGSEVCLRSAQMTSLRLDSAHFHGHKLTIYAQKTLQDPFGCGVSALAEVGMADAALLVHDVQRWPVAVFEGVPNRVVVVDRDRIVESALTD